MSVTVQEGAIVLAGDCPVEDAETLLGLLIDNPLAPVDISDAGRVHTAVLQVLLAARRSLTGPSPATFFGTWLLPPVLDAGPESGSTANGMSAPGGDSISSDRRPHAE